jgi:hypothetical protein
VSKRGKRGILLLSPSVASSPRITEFNTLLYTKIYSVEQERSFDGKRSFYSMMMEQL